MVEAFHDYTFRMYLTHYANLSFFWNCLIIAHLYHSFMNTSKKFCSRHFYLSVWIKPFTRAVRFLSLWLAISTSYCWRCLCLSIGLERTDIFFFMLQQFVSVLSVSWLSSFLTQSFTSFLCLRSVILGLKPLRLLFRFWQKKTFLLFLCLRCSHFFNLSLVYFSFLFLCSVFSTLLAVRFTSTAFLV